jgi:cytochrome P450
MNRIGEQLLANAKASMAASEKDGEVSGGGRDLLSLLVKSNMAAEGPRLSDAEVLAREWTLTYHHHTQTNSSLRLPPPPSEVHTFFVAGHDTTSTSVTWTLFALSNALDVQKKLRTELLACSTATPSMDELNRLPYLENVVREVLRLYSPVHQSVRVAVQDDVVQLDKSFVDVKGVTRHELRYVDVGKFLGSSD